MKLQAVSFRILVLTGVLLAALGCRSQHDLRKSSGQAGFGVEMARMNLWREAMFRFQRAIELKPDDAQAYNNLAVAYEANGDFENAAKAYRDAMRLDKSNQYIQKNYSRFVEFSSRNKKRGAAAAPAAPSVTAPASPPAPSSVPPPGAIPPDRGSPPQTSPPSPPPTPGASPKPAGGTR